jgi:hypothetical protein
MSGVFSRSDLVVDGIDVNVGVKIKVPRGWEVSIMTGVCVAGSLIGVNSCAGKEVGNFWVHRIPQAKLLAKQQKQFYISQLS